MDWLDWVEVPMLRVTPTWTLNQSRTWPAQVCCDFVIYFFYRIARSLAVECACSTIRIVFSSTVQTIYILSILHPFFQQARHVVVAACYWRKSWTQWWTRIIITTKTTLVQRTAAAARLAWRTTCRYVHVSLKLCLITLCSFFRFRPFEKMLMFCIVLFCIVCIVFLSSYILIAGTERPGDALPEEFAAESQEVRTSSYIRFLPFLKCNFKTLCVPAWGGQSRCLFSIQCSSFLIAFFTLLFPERSGWQWWCRKVSRKCSQPSQRPCAERVWGSVKAALAMEPQEPHVGYVLICFWGFYRFYIGLNLGLYGNLPLCNPNQATLH